ncbi:unnamed protein product [Bursaphelenchus okinawaensis]|uniref:SET domain-containing protein n=1 Tax=Bursaphelenchus okinawaensis TaxID=465554 RepID=A0A811JUK2_9BILA|nr:unnamed protein product [Bursaphelenchus okinawaensis]CAG9083224.1 unnamed protein product [Bursaphelenchus okinawaensis]
MISDDISGGTECFPIPAVNNYDDKPLPEFTYITSSIYEAESDRMYQKTEAGHKTIVHHLLFDDEGRFNEKALRTQLKIQVYCKAEQFWGVRTLQTIPRGHIIGDYVGEVTRNRVDDTVDSYIFGISEGEDEWFVNAYRKGNFTRFINHSCNWNTDSLLFSVDGRIRVILYTNRDIRMNEEITIDYGQEWWQHNYALKCLCKQSNCDYNKR